MCGWGWGVLRGEIDILPFGIFKHFSLKESNLHDAGAWTESLLVGGEIGTFRNSLSPCKPGGCTLGHLYGVHSFLERSKQQSVLQRGTIWVSNRRHAFSDRHWLMNMQVSRREAAAAGPRRVRNLGNSFCTNYQVAFGFPETLKLKEYGFAYGRARVSWLWC